ncbi:MULTISPECIES: hypothetical protein [unclassified Streptomyces]
MWNYRLGGKDDYPVDHGSAERTPAGVRRGRGDGSGRAGCIWTCRPLAG